MFGFIIPTCCKSQLHINQLVRCLTSIRNFYKNIPIILINDSEESFDIYSMLKPYKNISIIKSCKKGSADQQVFKVFKETTLFETAVFIQDSMVLNKPFDNIINIIDIQFLWHFTNHRVHWDIIREPQTEYNIKNNITTHSSAIKHYLKKDYTINPEFNQYALDALSNKNTWVGCFGSCCIITKKGLEKLCKTIDFTNIFVNYTDNRQRRVNESIFSLLCHYTFPDINFEDSYDGLYYDGKTIKQERYTNFDGLKWCATHNYINKVSFNR